MRIKDFLRFLLCAGLFIAGLIYFFNQPQPKQDRKKPPVKEPGDRATARATPALVAGGAAGHLSMQAWQETMPALAAGSFAGQLAAFQARKNVPAVKQPAERRAVHAAPDVVVGGAAAHLARQIPRRVTLGSAAGDSPFHLQVEFDSRGAAVRRLVLNKFKTANRLGKAVNSPLELIPPPSDDLPVLPDDRKLRPLLSNVLYHYEVRDANADRPVDTLGNTLWQIVETQEGNTTEEHSVSFQTTLHATDKEGQSIPAVRITKTYRLPKKSYHLVLEVKLQRASGFPSGMKFRYQLTGAHGLPIEGDWYTSTFRHALIGRLEDNSLWRNYQDLNEIARKEGGDAVLRDGKRFLQYAGVAVQYFASVIVVDDKQNEGQGRDYLASARPTFEGRVVAIELDHKVFPTDDRITVRFKNDKTRPDEIYYLSTEVAAKLAAQPPKKGEKVGLKLVPLADGDKLVAVEVMEVSQAQPLFLDDITVRVNTEPIELPETGEVTHRYLLYNGPVKAMLLGQMAGEKEVPAELVQRYVETLHLNTLTDYQSPGAMGTFASKIWLTNLIILFTNLCHRILYLLHLVIPSYGICIILLTVIVRGAMFPLSRKQAMTGMRMQELAPELKKMKEKFKDDRQAFAVAQMELFRKHGVNPLGSCWMLFLQLPIFMGLYYCLQESIFFRLAPFLWISNLAAPDMLIEWGQSIPFISRPEDYGSLIYLGPFFNVLPIVAVTLMIFQQKMLMPPPADEQAAMQQKIMKYMMIFFGLLFYKVAAGLCLYFIASSLWGFAERKWLPKKKPATEGETLDSQYQKMRGDVPPEPARSASNGQNDTAASNRAKRRQERKKQRERYTTPVPASAEVREAADAPQASGLWARLREWWQDVLKKASKK